MSEIFQLSWLTQCLSKSLTHKKWADQQGWKSYLHAPCSYTIHLRLIHNNDNTFCHLDMTDPINNRFSFSLREFVLSMPNPDFATTSALHPNFEILKRIDLTERPNSILRAFYFKTFPIFMLYLPFTTCFDLCTSWPP